MSLITLNLEQPQRQVGTPHAHYDLSSLVGFPTIAGQIVTPQRAERVSGVLACLRILTEDVASSPLVLRRRTPQGSLKALDDSRFSLFHDNFNPQLTAFEGVESAVWDCLLFGSAYFLKEMDRTGRVSALYPLSATRVCFKDQLSDGTLRFQYSAPDGGTQIFLDDELWRFPMLAQAGFPEGRALTLLAREAISLLMAAEEQGGRFFSNGVQTNFVLQTDNDLDADDAEALVNNFNRKHAGAHNAWRTVLLDNGVKAQKIGLTAEESQYIESRNLSLADIARIFRIPGVLLGIGEKTSTYASAEQFFLSYVRNTLIPWFRRIESSAKRDLFAVSESDLFLKFDVDHQLRADMKTRFDAYSVAIASRVMTPNECRELEDLPQLPGLDEPVTSPSTQKLAKTVAAIGIAHETRLLSDGKPAAEVYGKLLPPFLRDRCGMTDKQIQDYGQARLNGQGTDVLVKILTAA
jgi:HK97 family phage portal protein